ncbi:DUF3152 domain-containing protein [Streptomyces sp. DSM 44917]|uniref:DUF3152 domain-containing protein n=1 Tax=Streptomyces boetiae TaxID=3075541 RepID=A0ABU2L863_9ACTN|nr:DUF3152 domain-containing protein [Streptomyces sp. DSM 44917]MDT0307680.1 DUF3152 domain-containing protein [Streptomyces sp. DSM 44917]
MITGIAAASALTALGVFAALRLAGPEPGAAAVADGQRPGQEEPAGGRGADQGGTPAPDTLQGGPGGTNAEPGAAPAYDELLHTMFRMDPEATGSGELVPVGGSDPASDPDAATVYRYRVDVESGLGLDGEFFAEMVHRTLNDERGWGNGGERGFARVSGGDYDFVITLASPGTTAEWCALSGLDTTEDNVSCDSASTERVMINAWRWSRGAETYGEDIAGYRQMLVNHEVGHRLGYNHVLCPGEGEPAPVMMQQTKFLETEGLTCTPNPWPHPEN